MTNQLNVVEESYFKTIFVVLVEIFEFVLSIILLCRISIILTLFVVIVTICQMVVPKIMDTKLSKNKSKQLKCADKFNVMATEHLNAFDLMDTFALKNNSIDKVENANEELENSKYTTRIVTSFSNLLSYTTGQILYLGVYFFGAILTIKGFMTVGAMVAASQLVVYIASPLQTISEDITEIKSAAETIKYIQDEILSSEEKNEGNINIPNDFEKIDIKNLSFMYDEKYVLLDANCSILKNHKYILSGESGSGKSTLMHLLLGKLKPINGGVFVDDVNIRDFIPKELSSFVLECSQNIFIFNATIKDNITVFNNEYSDEEVECAVKWAGLGDVIDDKGGIYSIVTQNGLDYSGGEKGRIALARIKLYDPKVIILDESFAALDEDSAYEIVSKITHMQDKTVIFIGHHVSNKIKKLFDEEIEIVDKKLKLKEI